MVLNNIGIVQQNENQYLFYLPNNVCVANLILPSNRKSGFKNNVKALESISRAIAVRFGVYKKKEHKDS